MLGDEDVVTAPAFDILVAEDSQTQAAKIQAVLEQAGWSVRVVGDGLKALAEARRQRPSLVITDIVMPQMDGYALCRALKEDPALRSVPVILLTHLSDPSDIARGLEVGADNFIQKPYRAQYLMDRVAYMLHATEMRRGERVSAGLEIELQGRRYFINSERQQILDLLISTYEQSVELNTELRERQEALERRNLQLTSLFKIAEGLNHATSEMDVAENAMELALDLPGVQGGWISLVDHRGDWRMVASRNLPEPLRGEGAEENRCVCHESDASDEERALNRRCDRLTVNPDTQGPRFHAFIPLRSGDGRVGVLCLIGPGDGRLPDEDRDALLTVGHQVTVALARARLQENLKRLLEKRTVALSEEHAARGQIQEALTIQEQRFETLVATAPDGIFVIEGTGRVRYANRRAEEMLGYPPDGMRDLAWEALGEEAGEWRARIARESSVSPGTQTTERRLEMARKDGSKILVSVTMSASEYEGTRDDICFVRDVTEQVQMEQWVQQVQKMEAIGQLTGGVAHDFNNLLGIIIGNLDLMQLAAKDDPVVKKRIDAALRAALNGANLTKRLLAFARKQPLSPAAVCLSEVLNETRPLIERILKGDLALIMNIPPLKDVTLLDPGEFENVILNLAINARDAMPHGGTLTVELGIDTLDERYVRINGGGFNPGRYLKISVSDTGSGMTPEVLAHAFEPFFTTKEKGKGTGLGLAMAHGFIKQSGGHIKVYSEPGFGTSFHIYLPIITDLTVAPREQDAPQALVGGHERILVVDDEEDLAEVAMTYLSDLGYVTRYARSGEEALQTLFADGGFALVLTDIVMPGGMDGMKLHRQVAEKRPAIRFVYTSGFSDAALKAKSGGSLRARLVAKPYRREELARAIRATLDDPPESFRKGENS
ncbi:MAG: response regulator [Nitrospinae bacterium]|nr:response regulator [Nitrospinota bacterium]